MHETVCNRVVCFLSEYGDNHKKLHSLKMNITITTDITFIEYNYGDKRWELCLFKIQFNSLF
jgi:hypothetical protein